MELQGDILSIPGKKSFVSLCCADDTGQRVPCTCPLGPTVILHLQMQSKAAFDMVWKTQLHTIWGNLGGGTAWSQHPLIPQFWNTLVC